MIIQQGRNAWKLARPDAAGVLIDAADYYRAFYQAAERAEHSILLSGWQFDRGVQLLRGDDAPPGEDVRLLKFLDRLCQQKPELHVDILAWDFQVVFALEREWMQNLYFEWATHKRLTFRFDDTLAKDGSHHQKFAVIDRAVSFVGGIDICEARWDDRRHRAENPLRVSHGDPVKPYHDVQAYFAGCAVADVLRELFMDRWARTKGAPLVLPPCDPSPGADYRPRGAMALGAGAVAFSRTDPRAPGQQVREVERLFADAIAAAERLIYVETQYFTSRAVRDALVERMRRGSGAPLQIVVVLNEKPEAMKEELILGLRQAKVLWQLTQVASETRHALGVYYSLCDGDDPNRRPTYIHTKLLSVDDRFLTVGSANFTNRSMGVDTELHASWEADGGAGGDAEALREAITAIRASLIAEHTGLPEAEGAALAAAGDLVARLDALADAPNARLRRHRIATDREKQLLQAIDPAALPYDPAQPEFPDDDRDPQDREEEAEEDRPLFIGGIGALRALFKRS